MRTIRTRLESVWCGASRLRWSRGLAACAALIVAAWGLVGCGPDDGKPCGGECTYGVCDEQRDECVNADECEPATYSSSETSADAGTDAGGVGADAGIGGVPDDPPASDCIQGYSCVGGSCQPDETCDSENSPCSRGTCRDGRCVNEDQCVTKEDCRENFRCYNGSCVYAPCSDTNCERGVCDKLTGECVNADECSADADPPEACIEGYTCHDGDCYEKSSFCETVDCERGVCDSEEAACVNAEDCDEDAECLEGLYCTGEGNCETNECYEVKRICDRGVCDPADQSCGNPETCSELADCAPMYSCLEDECVANSELCGEEGCPGNQVCSYDEESLSASCEENSDEPCRNAIDCRGDRVCRDGSCGDPVSCSNDDWEPNNGAMEATSYFDKRLDGRIRGTVCSGDKDFYAFDTERDEDFRGEFAVQLKYNPVDVGISDLNVRVLRPDGSLWFEERVDGDEGEALIRKQFGAGAPKGIYQVVVEDPGDVRDPGIRYEALIDIISQESIDACQKGETLETPSDSGNTNKGESVGLDASCVQEGDEQPEDLYEFTIEEKSYVEIEVQPDGAADLTAAIRSECELPVTEQACTNTAGVGGTETVSATLDPGTYYLIVQGTAASNSGGKYTTTFSRRDADCTDSDNQCVSDSEAKICSPEGRNLETEQCQLGCDQRRNRCVRAEGDVCYKSVDGSGGLSGHTVDYGKLRNSFESAGATCLPNSRGAEGPDKVFDIEVPAGEVLLADLNLSSGQDGSMYVLSECEDASTFCEQGVDSNSNTESLRYPNRTASSDQVFLVVDSAAGTSGTAELDVSIEELICQPGTKRCNGADVQQCNNAGTAWNTQKSCKFGCSNGTCVGDNCAESFDVTGGGSWTFDPGNYNDDYTVNSNNTGCFSGGGFQGTTMDGPDVVFRADVPAGQVLEAKLTEPSGSSYDSVVYIVEDCADTATHESTCQDGSNDVSTGTERAVTLNESGSTTSYFIVADAVSTGSTPSDWTLDVTVQQPTCTPLDKRCADSSTLEYCTRTGLKYASYKCQGSPSDCTTSGSDTSCADPTGDYCYDPKEYSGSAITNKTVDMGNQSNQIEVPQSCTSRDTEGNDLIYEVEASAGETIDVSAAESSQSFSQDPGLYIMKENCLDEQSACVAGSDSRFGGSESLSYTVPSGEGGTYYVVYDATDTFESDDDWDISLDVQ